MTTTEGKTANLNPDHEIATVSAAGHTTVFGHVLDSYREHRAVRALHHRVEQELASYTSEADIHELDAMLERSEGDRDSVYTQMIQRVRMRAA